MFSQTAEYALRAAVWLAGNHHRPHTTREIAEATHVPQGYLAKVLGSLQKSGILTSQRGLHGGFRLARPPEEITVYDVVEAVDPLPRIRECPLGIEEHGRRLCPLHRRLDDAMACVEEAFRSTSIAEVLRPRDPAHPLCRAAPPGSRPKRDKE